jgi:hypothetical protein
MELQQESYISVNDCDNDNVVYNNNEEIVLGDAVIGTLDDSNICKFDYFDDTDNNFPTIAEKRRCCN